MYQELMSWLDRVERSEATGRVNANGKRREQLVWQFVETFYSEVFVSYAEEQRSILNSRLNRFKGGCEAVFSQRYSKQGGSSAEQGELATDDGNSEQ